MSGNLSPQFLHYSDHVFEPGDLVLPPAESGAKSKHEYASPREDQVYVLHGPYAHTDPYYRLHYGQHAYEVAPHGPVARDPEYDPNHPDDVVRERGEEAFVAPRARVIRRIDQ